MKKKIFNLTLKFFSLILIFVLFFILFDLSAYDPSYINRSSLTFNKNNLNSKKSKLLLEKYENISQSILLKFSKKHKDFWTVENKDLRNSLPKSKIIKKKNSNFVDGQPIEDVEKNFSNWPRSHGGFHSMRFSSLDLINKSNINKLDLAWQFNSKDGKKGIQANPVIYEGLIYLPTPGNSIVCLDGSNGKELWRYKTNKGYNAAKRGLLIWIDKKKNIPKLIFTNDDQLIVLNAKTGAPIKNFGENGIVKIGSSSIPPVIIDDKLVIATFRPSIEVYNLTDGELKWKYYLREINKKEGEKDFKGGFPWGGISADTKNGIIYLTTGNPKPNFVGTLRPGKNLFANSLIAFDVRNKKKLWHFQESCHDLWNHDIPSPPIVTTINKYNKRIDVVIAVTKLGNTLILDRYSGEPIFDYEMRLAPTSILPGEKTCEYQPDVKIPEPFAKNIFKAEDITNLNEESSKYISSIVDKSNYGFFATYEIEKDTIQYGDNGGAQWTGASVDPYNNILYVTANNIPWIVGVNTKKTKKNKNIIYTDKRAVPLRDKKGYPGVKPPWGTLTALNLNSGKILWQSTLGYYEKLKERGVITGTENFGGATATSGGLVFVSGTLDKMIRAFDSKNGKELWSFKLPYIGSAPPSSYKINGEQYIIIPASGGIILKLFYPDLVEQGDAVLAFKIKD
jgi:glucose dehydrogenase